MSLDREKILNGTLQKRFDAERRSLAEEYNESTARDFHYVYLEAPLSFILHNSRDIFSESFFGYKFYKDIIEKSLLCPLTYKSERDKVNHFVNQANQMNLPKQQLQLYVELRDLLDRKIKEHTASCRIFDRGTLRDQDGFVDQFLDIIYDAELTKDDSLLEEAANILFSIKDICIKLALGVLFCKKYPKYLKFLNDCTRMPIKHCGESDEWYKKCVQTETCISELMKDPPVSSFMKDVASDPAFCDISLNWGKCANMDFAYRKLDQQAKKPTIDTSFVPAAANVVSHIYESAEDIELLESCDKFTFDTLTRRKLQYEIFLETAVEDNMLGYVDEEYVEMCEDILYTAEAELEYMEWEDNGEPNAVIKKHIQTSKDIQAAIDEKEKNRIEQFHQSLKNLSTTDDNSRLAGEVVDDISKAIREISTKKFSDGSDFDEYANKLKQEIDAKAVSVKDLPEVRVKLEEFKNTVEEYSELYEFGDDGDIYQKQLEAEIYLEDFREDHEKPKKDFATKVQDKALDYNAKAVEKDAERGEKFQKLKNAGNAISQRPKHLLDRIGNSTRKLDKMDDNRRKEFMLKPGYRHKLFKQLRTALQYGIVAKIKLAWVPAFAMLKRLSKSKNKRIRNEVAMELDAEIKICEEKINDANSDNDRETKYELMRIRDKLVAERTRVRTNSKYV